MSEQPTPTTSGAKNIAKEKTSPFIDTIGDIAGMDSVDIKRVLKLLRENASTDEISTTKGNF